MCQTPQTVTTEALKQHVCIDTCPSNPGCGLYLPAPVFAHGQLYVALSRVGTAANLRVLIEETSGQGCIDDSVYTQNVVFTEIFHA